MDTFTLKDFEEMPRSLVFGFYCMGKLDEIKCPTPMDYARVHDAFTDLPLRFVREQLADEGINKPDDWTVPRDVGTTG